ncbi:MAG: hypothetical protein ACXVEI_03340 [Actinomycetota bacterium]
MPRKTIGVTVLALGLLATACANTHKGGGAGSGGLSFPSGATQLVLRIDQGGGFVAPQSTLADMPMFSLFGDGLVVTPGARTMIYPGSALPAVAQERLTPDAIQLLLQAAVDAGLNTDRTLTDMGSVGVSDMPTTTFTLVVDGQTHTTRVYALGQTDSKPSGMSQTEFQARQALQAFEAKATDLGWLPQGSISDSGAFQPDGLRVYVTDYHGDQTLTEPEIAWPLTPGLATFGQPLQGALQGLRCGAVTGADTATLLPAVQNANELTPWTSDGSRYSLVFRALLPDEHGC